MSEPDVNLPYHPAPLVGHTTQQADLLALLVAGRMPHGILVHGPKGIGKRLFAEQLAWRLLCGPAEGSTGQLFTYNPHTPAAAQLGQGAHGSYFVLEPTEGRREIRVEDVRTMTPRLHLSAESWRVVIVDAADDLNPNSANALLKTLEEPLPFTLLILLSHQPSRLLPTIISRCRQVRLGPLEDDELAQVLSRHEITLPAQVLAPLAAGSPGYALHVDNAAATVLPVLARFFTHEIKAVLPDVSATAVALLKNSDIQSVFSLLNWWVAQCAYVAGCGTLRPCPPDAQEPLQDCAPLLGAAGWARLYAHLARMQALQAEVNMPAQLCLETALGDIHNWLAPEEHQTKAVS